MTFKKYNTANNAICSLDLPITNSSNIIIAKGNFNRFPTSNFIIKITQYNGNIVIGRENILISSRSGSTFSVSQRAVELVPIDDNASSNIQQALSFDADSIIELVISSATITDIQDEVTRLENDKLNKSGGTMTGLLKLALGANIASATTTDLSVLTGNSATIKGTTTITSFGSVTAGTKITLTFEGILTLTHNATSLILPGNANITTTAGDVINLLSLGSGNWRCEGYQKADGTAIITNAAWYRAGNGSDGALNISSGTTTLPFLDGIVIKNYSSINISGTATLTFSGKSTNGGIAILNCLGDFTMTAGTIDISSMGANGGAGTSGANTSGSVGKNGLAINGLTPSPGGSPGNSGADTLATVGVRVPVSYESGFICGSGGGGGGSQNTGTGTTGAGGIGGGCIIINVSGNVKFSGGTINANGGNGGNSSFTGNGGGGGGGGGGRVLIIYGGNLVSSAGTITVAGGSGGSPSGFVANAGGGGGGTSYAGLASWSRATGVGQAGANGISAILKFINS